MANVYEANRTQRGTLELAVKRARAQAWTELLADLDRDPCERPYRIGTGKLQPWAPPPPRRKPWIPPLGPGPGHPVPAFHGGSQRPGRF